MLQTIQPLNNWARQNEKWLARVLIFCAFTLFGLGGIFGLEGGVPTVGAERVLAGEIPYRDFWTMYAPGHFYLLALLFAIFGKHLLIELIAASLITAIACGLVYRVIVNLIGARVPAFLGALIFFGAMYNTLYFKTLNSYVPAIFLILVTLAALIHFYKTGQLAWLIGAGLANGGLVVFKHDVGAYTALAIALGLTLFHLLQAAPFRDRVRLFIKHSVAYALASLLIALPWFAGFALVAGPAMAQDLVIFPLTDFRYARPEAYPSILPIDLLAQSWVMTIFNLTVYFNFAIPSVLFLLGLGAIVWALKKRDALFAALGATFAVGFLFHYSAAHVQINTHIVTMSLYSIGLGSLLYNLLTRAARAQSLAFVRILGLALMLGWLLTLIGKPLYLARENLRGANVELKIDKVAGFRVSADDASALTELTTFIKNVVPPNQKIFVGLHRHDVVIISDVMLYFILDRPVATRYQELHPAITDTARAQQEMIRDLERERVAYLVLKNIFADDVLESVKRDFLKHLPNVGATDLDQYIRANYTLTRQFGAYAVWQRTSK
ncbi:MAG: glycosyltransferase family 39 protein [Chloroflexi bacterium]|nr:glycosyltransferase family 39 protein [Chloroflexota bacterium]